MFSDIFNKLFTFISTLPFDKMVYIIWGSFAAIFVLSFFACLLSSAIKKASKRPYLCLLNAYSALTIIVFLTKQPLNQALLATCVFWFLGYLSYGILCIFSRKSNDTYRPITITQSSVQPRQPSPDTYKDIPPANNVVRLEHALTIVDKLLTKNLGKGDRQEIDKLKSTLTALETKGILTPTENDALNDHFSSLIKLMSKYNI